MASKCSDLPAGRMVMNRMAANKFFMSILPKIKLS